MKALIVEDEKDICYLLSEILRKKSFTTSYVTSINKVNQALSTLDPSVLFLDNHLPDGSGMDIISDVKKDHPKIKIVMITAHDTNADKQRALSQGADVFIGKPFTTDTIYKTLDKLFSKIA